MDSYKANITPAFQEAESSTENTVNRKELSSIVESVLARMPIEFREVIVLKDLNDMSIADAASSLNISEANVKVRLHRARRMMRRKIEEMYRPEDIFEFNLIYCDAIVNRVMTKIRELTH